MGEIFSQTHLEMWLFILQPAENLPVDPMKDEYITWIL